MPDEEPEKSFCEKATAYFMGLCEAEKLYAVGVALLVVAVGIDAGVVAALGVTGIAFLGLALGKMKL